MFNHYAFICKYLHKIKFTNQLIHVLLIGLALALVLVTLIITWLKYPQFLYLYRDGEYNLWISHQTSMWSRPFDLTSINPLQGMTSMLVTINPYFDPGQWIFFSHLSENTKIISSYSIYALEIILSTFAMGIVLNFSRLHSFISSLLIAFILLPPFNFSFGLSGWLAVSPTFAHTISMSNLCTIICWKLGNFSYHSKLVAILKNMLLICIFVTIVLCILLQAPFYNVGLCLGMGIILTYVTFCSNSREQIFWLTVAGLTLFTSLYLLGLPEFYLSAKASTVRFANHSVLPSNWFDILKSTDRKTFYKALDPNMLCTIGGGGFYCPSFPGWPMSLSTTWINMAIILGSFTVWSCMPRRTAKLGFAFAATWILLFLIIIILNLMISIFGIGILSLIILPSWLYLVMYPIGAIFAIQVLAWPMGIAVSKTNIKFSPIHISFLMLFIAVIISIGWLLSFRGARLHHHSNKSLLEDSSTVLLVGRHPLTPIIESIKNEISLTPNKLFNGSVATIYGTAEGSLRRATNVTATKHVTLGQFEEFLIAAAKSGSSHDLLDLWAWNIPTLSEYGQGLSKPLLFYTSKFLSNRDDAIESHFSFPHRPNIDILRALGVRFIITDASLNNDKCILHTKINAGSSSTIFLYELHNPNLGNYSPTKLLPLKDIKFFKQLLISNPNVLESNAYVENPLSTPLTQAYDAKLYFQKGGIHVTAKSKGTSALLLPIQFSNCYKVDMSPNVKIMRANLIHTLIVFTGNLDTTLQWELHWLHSHCRMKDVEEMNKYFL